MSLSRMFVLALPLAMLSCGTGSSTSGTRAGADSQPDRARERMVDEQIRARGIKNDAVLRAMTTVPRHLFVPPDLRHEAYGDTPLPIGLGQTISQPYIVAFMTEALEPTPSAKVLEIGTGSGYQAAVLASIVREVYTIEIVPELAARAERTLKDAGFRNIHTRTGDGYAGWPEAQPFDGIIVTAAPDHVPQPLVDQLAVGGRMVIPVGVDIQELLVISKTPSGVVQRKTLDVRFVPLRRKPGG